MQPRKRSTLSCRPGRLQRLVRPPPHSKLFALFSSGFDQLNANSGLRVSLPILAASHITFQRHLVPERVLHQPTTLVIEVDHALTFLRSDLVVGFVWLSLDCQFGGYGDLFEPVTVPRLRPLIGADDARA